MRVGIDQAVYEDFQDSEGEYHNIQQEEKDEFRGEHLLPPWKEPFAFGTARSIPEYGIV